MRNDLLYGKSALRIKGNQAQRNGKFTAMSSPAAQIDLVHQAIAAGIFGHIQWDDTADERARSNPDLQGLTPEAIRRLLHDFVCDGRQLDEMREARLDWLQINANRPAYYRDS
jgi:hypothetical protein